MCSLPPSRPQSSSAPRNGLAALRLSAEQARQLRERPTLDGLAAAWRQGEPVSLDDVFDAAGLTPQERHVIAQGWDRTLEDIAQDAELRKPDGTSYSRQRIHQLEASARAKLGMTTTRSALQEQDRLDRGVDLHARSKGTVPVDLHNVEGRRIGPREQRERRQEQRLSQLTDQYIREAEQAGGPLSAQRTAYYAGCFAR